MIRRDALSEYVRGSLWVLPTLSVLAALAEAVAGRPPGPPGRPAAGGDNGSARLAAPPRPGFPR
jgi:hypothetical protein